MWFNEAIIRAIARGRRYIPKTETSQPYRHISDDYYSNLRSALTSARASSENSQGARVDAQPTQTRARNHQHRLRILSVRCATCTIMRSLVRARSRVVSSLQEIAFCIARNTRFLPAHNGPSSSRSRRTNCSWHTSDEGDLRPWISVTINFLLPRSIDNYICRGQSSLIRGRRGTRKSRSLYTHEGVEEMQGHYPTLCHCCSPRRRSFLVPDRLISPGDINDKVSPTRRCCCPVDAAWER